MSYVRYEDFGAVGDGTTNDLPAICKAHEYANNTCQKVLATKGKTYYLSSSDGKFASIKTDTDWTGATFIIDDASIPADSSDNSLPIFKAESDYEKRKLPDEVVKQINESGGIDRRSTQKINTGLGYPAMLRLIDEDHICYRRWGGCANPGRAQVEILLVDADGFISKDTPFMMDYSHVSYVYERRSDDRPITISGGKFITKVSPLDTRRGYVRGIVVSRNNLTIRGIDHEIVGECDNTLGPVYAGFLYILDACYVLVEDSFFQAHKYYGVGTYDLLIEFTAGVTLRNCKEHNFFLKDDPIPSHYRGYWGIMGGNYSKNLVYEGCMLSRFDSHAGLYNARISDSTLASISITGGGTILIENTEIYRHDVINLRADFGSTFDGEIILRGVKQNTFQPKIARVISTDWVNHDFGYKCYFPNITIENFSTNAGPELPICHFGVNTTGEVNEAHLEVLSDGTKNQNPYTPPDRITVSGSNNVKLTLLDIALFEKTEKSGI